MHPIIISQFQLGIAEIEHQTCNIQVHVLLQKILYNDTSVRPYT